MITAPAGRLASRSRSLAHGLLKYCVTLSLSTNDFSLSFDQDDSDWKSFESNFPAEFDSLLISFYPRSSLVASRITNKSFDG